MSLSKKNSKVVQIGVVLALLNLISVFAADPDFVVIPGKKDVMIIGRIVVRNTLDMPFYAKSFDLDANQPDTYTIPIQFVRSKYGMEAKKTHTYTNGDFFFQTRELEKDRLSGYELIPFDFCSSKKARIELPLHAAFTVPEGVQYLYIGSYYYDIANDSFAIKAERIDEFDQAQALVKKIDPTAELQRAVLQKWVEQPVNAESKK